MSETPYDRWKTTPPETFATYCPECDSPMTEDDYQWVCEYCGESIQYGPDPDEAYDRLRDQELEKLLDEDW